MSKVKEVIFKLTGFDKSQHKIRTEIIAGLTIFVTMCYILAVAPAILSETGMDRGAVFTATALTAALSTILMAIMGKLPFAQAPGLSINAFFTFTIVKQLGYSWQTAITIMLVVGLIFMLIVAFNIQKLILKAIPTSLRNSISVGVGIFIAFIGLQNADILVDNPDTLLELGKFTPKFIVAFLGIILSAVFMSRKIKGGLFISILICTIIGIPLGVTQIPEQFHLISMPHSLKPTLCIFDFSNILKGDVLVVIFTLLFLCIFDTMGTLLGLADRSGMTDKDGNLKHFKGALMSDAIGTTFGALTGTSAVGTFAESASGIAEGGRTGITAITTGILFLIALFLAPLFLLIPLAATTGSLVMVGVLMIESVHKISFTDVTEGLPAFLTIIMIPLSYSIGGGIMIAILTYVLVKTAGGRFKDTNIIMYILAALILLKFILDVL